MKFPAYFRSVADLDRSRTEHQREEAQRAEDVGPSNHRADATRRAHMEGGGDRGVRYKKEQTHQASSTQFLTTLFQDARFSLRQLRRSPGFTVTAIFTLALGIGANAVVFGVTKALILYPLKFPKVESLYAIQHGDRAGCSESYPDYLDIRDRNHSFESLAAYAITAAALDVGRSSARVQLMEASGNYFDTLKVQPFLGRFFHASDERGANSIPYIVLTYDFWQTHFRGDRNVVGQTVLLNKHPFTIIGVARPEFHGALMFFYPLCPWSTRNK